MARNLLSLKGVQKSHDGRPLITDASFGVDEGERVGIIGANGCGKSTLLRLICGQLEPEGGQVTLRGGVRLALLEQTPQLGQGQTVREVLQSAVAPVRDAIAAYEQAVSAMQPDAHELLEEIERLGGWDYQHRLESAAQQVGITELDAEVDRLSGGEQKRVTLARLLLQAPDLVLMDEPTNHLDAEMVAWLETWLKQTKSTVILVTHDRYFLDNVVTRLLELRHGTLRGYTGNYTDYLSARALEEAQRERTHHRQLRILMSELEWARRSPQARTTKSRARLERIEATQAEVEGLTGKPFVANFTFGAAPRLGGTILEIKEVGLQYPGGPPLINNLTLELRRGERIGILGPNGAGKTSLLKIITGELQPTTGEVRLGKNTQIAYFDQHRAAMEPEATVRGILTPNGGDQVCVGGEQPRHVASWLDRFGFDGSMHQRPVGTLSGGERNRLAIARFLLQPANLLILDEPTNDLDIPTLNTLEEAIAAFEGCVLLVSHDRYLLDKVATGILGFEQDYAPPGTVTFLQGSYTDYLERRLEPLRTEARREAQGAPTPNKTDSKASNKTRTKTRTKGLTYAERLELEGLEPKIEAADAQVAELQERLNDPALWTSGGDEGRSVQLALEEAQARAAQLYARWEDLLTRQEQA